MYSYSHCYSFHSCLAVALFVAAFSGCAEKNTGEVSGTVQINGQPVEGVQVEFLPMKEGISSSLGYSSEGGVYRLVHGRGERAIPVGEYKVTIGGIPESTGGIKLAPKYASAEKTELKRTVVSGENTINFDLKTN